MKGTEYKKFIQLSKEALKEQKSVEKKQSISTNEIFIDIEALKKHIYHSQIKKINNLPDHLNNFENKARQRNIKVQWAIDYTEAFEELVNIKKIFEVKNVWYKREYILEEIGIQHFLKEQNLSFSSIEDSDMLIYQANGMIEESGSLYLEFNDKSIFESINYQKPKIFFVGIEDLFINIQEIELYRSVYSLYKENKKSPEYSLIYSPYKESVTAPVYVIIIDNGRSNLLEDPEIRKTLMCINCDACSQVCPVTKTIGKEPYDNVFYGPIANVTLPYLEQSEEYNFLCNACTLCGNCERICPMNIPLTGLILKNRNHFFGNDLGKLKSYLSNRKKMNSTAWIKNGMISMNLNSDFKKNRKLRSIEDKTFNQLWMEQNKNKQDV